MLPTPEYSRRLKWYAKKKKRELSAVLDNLDTYFKSLQAGLHPMQIKAGFIHPEPKGVVAIDQRGGGKSLAETRLYAFPQWDKKVLHLLTLGDKGGQPQDIQNCKDFVDELTATEEESRTASETVSGSKGESKPVSESETEGESETE